jgi:hypothetical protein
MTTVAGIRETLFRRRFSHRSLALSLALSLSRFLAFSLPRPLAPSLPRSLVCARVLSLTHSLSLSLSIPLALPLSRSHVCLLSLWPSPQTPPFLSFLSLARFLPLSLSRSLALSLSRPSLSLRSSCCGRPWRKGFRGIHTDPRARIHTHTQTHAAACVQSDALRLMDEYRGRGGPRAARQSTQSGRSIARGAWPRQPSLPASSCPRASALHTHAIAAGEGWRA